MKGMKIPVIEIAIAALPTLRTSPRSVSMPVSSNSKRMPSCASKAFLLRRGREDRVLRLGPYPAEQGGTKQQTAEEFAHDGRLADALDYVPKPAAHGNQEGYLGQQQEFGRTRGLLVCSLRNRDHQ